MTSVTHDYRVPQPQRVIDPNQNTQEADYDAFGRVWATSFYGTERGQEVGFDPLDRSTHESGDAAYAIQNAQAVLKRQASVCYYDSNIVAPGVPLAHANLVADRYPDDPE
ncbi:hypothetical protein, partial [Pseudomonas viridiflava]|uniref:hypothetical protein n=1 Tax=Pseudomonas viridiflava TaxID=33069 RepID=UPI0013CF2FBA